MDNQVIRDQVIKLCLVCAKLFGADLDRKTLWERIGNGLDVCSAKCGGDIELLINYMLEYVKADPGESAACKELSHLIVDLYGKPEAWITQFIATCAKKRMVILVKAREEWESRKKVWASAQITGGTEDDQNM
jgi:hypothetical protein